MALWANGDFEMDFVKVCSSEYTLASCDFKYMLVSKSKTISGAERLSDVIKKLGQM